MTLAPIHRLVLSLLATVALGATDAPRPWPKDPFLPVTAERIAALPAAEQPAWQAYWEKSLAQEKLLPDRKRAREYAPAKPLDGPPIPAIYSTRLRLNSPEAWYATAEARSLADHLVTWQTPVGAWTKGGDYKRDAKPEDNHHDEFSGGTFDNDSTITELRFLARVIHAAAGAPDAAAQVERWRASFLRGLAYIFDAQYPNGGFPQIYPLVGGYHDAITFNDDALVHILELLHAIVAREDGLEFVPAESAALARERLAAGRRNLLACQLRDAAGRPTIWGQQHDALTLKPCAARNFEPAAECSRESASLVRFLLTLPQPDADVAAAIHGAMAWFDRHALHDVTWNFRAPAGTGLTPTPGAPPLWARFYEFETGKPIFGERDRTIHYDVAELGLERRNGYGWFNTAASELVPLYAKWKQSAPPAK
ncbi:MAG TPA: pectate lyase [Lacunisphaera sp.]|nr:pectate lyase [Lacunisphaera sp.]